jgi:hypothetical protein
MNDKRVSELMDMMVVHILFHRTAKALKIAQYLRNVFGMHTVRNLDLETGHRIQE